MLESNIEYVNSVLGKVPKYLYHGRVGKDYSKEELESFVNIYECEDEIEGKNLMEIEGRTSLDFAFHGFYLTPCEALARKWAYTKVPKHNEIYQILKYEVDYEMLETFNSKHYIVPDLNWATFVYNNRSESLKSNEYDYVFGFIADGTMANIDQKIRDGCYNDNLESFHRDVLPNGFNRFLFDYYGDKHQSCSKIIEYCSLHEYKNYQLCISSKRALKAIKLVDIIKVHKGYTIPHNINIDDPILRYYKKYVPSDLINQVKNRGEE